MATLSQPPVATLPVAVPSAPPPPSSHRGPVRGERGASLSWTGVLLLILAGCADGISDVTLGEEDEGDPCVVAPEITLGQTGTGELGPADCQNPSIGATDRWRFTLPQPTHVRIDLSSSAFDAMLELRNASGSTVAVDDDGGPGLDARILARLAPGTYTVLVRAYASHMQGTYRLRLSEAADCEPSEALAMGDAVSGTFDADDCLFQWGGLADRWSLELTEHTRVRFGIRSPQAQVAVAVEDATGQVFGDAVTDGPGAATAFDTDLPAGHYVVSAVRLDEQPGGGYELDVGPVPPCRPGTELTLDESVSGEITLDDCRFNMWAPADSFALTLTDETQLDLQLKSPEFQPLLVVFDQDRNEVVVAWDELGVGTARARVALEAGTYAVVVTAGGYPQEGNYELSLTTVDCAQVGAVEVGTPANGSLEPTDCQRPGRAYLDTWSLVLESERSLRMDLHSDAFDPLVILEDGSGVEIARNDDGGPGLDARLERTLPAGTYRLVVTSFAPQQVGAYRLTVTDAPVASGAPEAAVAAESWPEGAPKPVVAADPSGGALAALMERIRAAYPAPSMRAGGK